VLTASQAASSSAVILYYTLNRANLIKNEKNDLLADSHIILNSYNDYKYFS
jgi:hypothetical protein